MHAIPKTLSDFAQGNALFAFLEGSMLLFFIAAVLIVVRSSYRESRWKNVANGTNFNYVSTVVAGLILSAASSGIGIAPPPNSGVSAAPGGAGGAVVQSVSMTQSEIQQQAFKKICAWTYLVLGVICILVFVIPVEGREIHGLVKTVALTTLGFAASIFGGMTVTPVTPKPL